MMRERCAKCGSVIGSEDGTILFIYAGDGTHEMRRLCDGCSDVLDDWLEDEEKEVLR